MVKIEIDEAEFAVVLAGLIRMAQGAKVARDDVLSKMSGQDDPDQLQHALEIATKKQHIIDQAFATLSSVGKSVRENMAELHISAGGAMSWGDNEEVLDHLKWAASMWSEVVGELPILNKDGSEFTAR